MSRIVIATLNARFIHTSFGLRYLLANMGGLREDTTLLEFVISDPTLEIVDTILAQQPAIVGLGVYIWNVDQIRRLVSDLKRIQPNLIVVLGGPEVSYETQGQELVELADYVVAGEADLAFPELCRKLLAGEVVEDKVLMAPVPKLTQLQLPYELYDEEDIAHRVIYVEASRGCPFSCEFCLSSLEIPVRQSDLDLFLEALQSLLDRGARQFKFVDRTFNLNLRVSERILLFFLERMSPDLFLHFEMIPDRLPLPLRELISRFPPGSLQFEIGIQTFNPLAGELISRRQDVERLEDNLRFLRKETHVHIHADLIIGLPGETWESFAEGFDRLYALRPQEIQLGVLKRLKGTPIVRHDQAWEMVYSHNPPFEVLSHKALSYQQISHLRRMARHWDTLSNSGNFVTTLEKLILRDGSAFEQMWRLSKWLHQQEQPAQSTSLIRMMERIFEYGTRQLGHEEQAMAEALWQDYQRIGRRDIPHFLRRFDLQRPRRPDARQQTQPQAPARQRRHLVE